jgi:phosphoenolpyruvate carboxykinase (ATP)
LVKDGQSAAQIDWTSSACNALDPAVFEKLWQESLDLLKTKEEVIELNRTIGADAKYALPIKLLTDRALGAVFADNMFREIPKGLEQSALYDKALTILVLPNDAVESSKYAGHLRPNEGRCLALDLENNRALVRGTAYLGTIKKTVYTAMNYYCIDQDILPLHCSANEGKDADTAIILGLSGTGKTTLSADPGRALIGDDEHGWSADGIANFENGCYAKLIDLDKSREPEIFRISFEMDKPVTQNGVIIENAMMYPDGSFDLSDDRLTANSRVSYPMEVMQNVKMEAKGDHPQTIIFLTADAHGVLPPVAKLSAEEAQLWFLMGYTSKLAGTETGVTEPKSAFSRFFGEPFMVRHPQQYTDLMKAKIKAHQSRVYLINTGWSGGPYGTGKRMDINLTRRIVEAALSGELEGTEDRYDTRFHFSVPTAIDGVEAQMLDPKNTWQDKAAFEKRADALASQFKEKFENDFTNIGADLAAYCPGK